MIEMLITGEKDPVVLAELAKGRMRPKIPDLIEALESRWVAHHSTVARQILAHIDFLDDTIQTPTAEIVECVVPFEAAARWEERRVGKECVSTCSSRWWSDH